MADPVPLSREGRWPRRFELIRYFGWLLFAGVLLEVFALSTHGDASVILQIFATLSLVPAFSYLYVVILWHWKERYRGHHSDLWGVLILVEVSSWMKLVYLFRHLLPDMRGTGRYRGTLPRS